MSIKKRSHPYQKRVTYGLCMIFVAGGWAFAVSAEMQPPRNIVEDPSEMSVQTRGGRLDEYLSQEETHSPEETVENELLAPFAKPVEAVIKGVGSAIEPLLEEKEIKDEKGETKAKIKPQEGKVQVDF